MRALLVLAAAACLGLPPCAAADDAAAWAALVAGGHVLMLRHSQTDPGVGDPPGYRLDACATQRNLSPEGRRQARSFGARLSERGVAIGPVLTSRWCRCVDTARLAFGRSEPWPALDSFFDDRASEPARTRAVLERVRAWRGPGTLVLVTHQVNIVAAAGIGPAMGEAVVLDPTARVVGRIAVAP